MWNSGRGWNANPWMLLVLGIIVLSTIGSVVGPLLPILVVMALLSFAFLASRNRRSSDSENGTRVMPDWRQIGAELTREWGTETTRERRGRMGNEDYGDDEIDEARASRRRGPSPRDVANRAVRRAGNRLDTWLLDLDDIGLIAYRGGAQPEVHRLNDIDVDASHLRPFVVIDLPYEKGRGTLTFQLFDEVGEKRFEAKNVYQLVRGRNFITPRTYLPIGEDRPGGRWLLRVSIGDKLLAIHEFEVQPGIGGEIRSALSEDGEVDPWIMQRLAEQVPEDNLSLDDLLASQYEGEAGTDNHLR